MRELLRNLLWDESGQDKIEFALIAALIALVLLDKKQKIGDSVSNAFKAIGNAVTKLKKGT